MPTSFYELLHTWLGMSIRGSEGCGEYTYPAIVRCASTRCGLDGGLYLIGLKSLIKAFFSTSDLFKRQSSGHCRGADV